MKENILYLLEQIRAIAQTGLRYAKDPYDKDRYQRLLDLSVEQYAELGDLDQEEIRKSLARQLGAISPKVAASAAIFSEDGKVLLIRRADTRQWTMPGGLCEVFESAAETAVREVREETGVEVEAVKLVDVYCGMAGTYGRVHTIYSLNYYCRLVQGTPVPTLEAIEVGFFDHRLIPAEEWHWDIQGRVERAYDFWSTEIGGR
jgi:ADP-ribose pyrophosphatase YjhB (NUDIX family)